MAIRDNAARFKKDKAMHNMMIVRDQTEVDATEGQDLNKVNYTRNRGKCRNRPDSNAK